MFYSWYMVSVIAYWKRWKQIDQHTDGIIVPKRYKENTFTVLVADNIDRQEGTLSGMYL